MGGRTLPPLRRHQLLDFGQRLIQPLRVLCARLRWVSESYEDVVFRRLPHRLARKILFLTEHFGEAGKGAVRISVPLSQQELGNMIGATRESINKQLRQWVRAGLVTYADGHISVLNSTEISRIAEREDEADGDPP